MRRWPEDQLESTAANRTDFTLTINDASGTSFPRGFLPWQVAQNRHSNCRTAFLATGKFRPGIVPWAHFLHRYRDGV